MVVFKGYTDCPEQLQREPQAPGEQQLLSLEQVSFCCSADKHEKK
jgi:hypothetical protein